MSVNEAHALFFTCFSQMKLNEFLEVILSWPVLIFLVFLFLKNELREAIKEMIKRDVNVETPNGYKVNLESYKKDDLKIGRPFNSPAQGGGLKRR